MIVAENVGVRFSTGFLRRKIKALDGLSLEVKEGDFFALVGRNGAGKSTAMYCFLGLIKPNSGSVSVMGRAPELGTSLYQKIAYLPEEPHYHLYLTVSEAVTYYGSLYGKRVSEKKVNDILERLGLAEFKHLKLDHCSKGMKQKMGIAQCLINEPRLMFLDEPTRGLDPLIVKELRDVLFEMHRSGTTIVMNSHVLSEIEMLANRVAIIDRGKLVLQEDIKNLVHLDRDLYVVEFELNGVLPDYVAEIKRTGNMVEGTISAEKVYDFMDYARQVQSRVYKCSLMKKTLEEALVNILRSAEHA